MIHQWCLLWVLGRVVKQLSLMRTLIDQNWQYVNLDDQAQLNLAKEDPIGFIRLQGRHSIAIDEVQRLPELLLAIKQSVDMDRRPGRFLLTGSANVLFQPKVADSLAGRMETIFLSPLSENEIQGSKPSFFLD